MPILPSPGPPARAVRGSPAAARRPTRLPLPLLRTCPHPAKPNRFGKRWALGSGACLQPRARRPTPSPSREHGAAGSPLPPPNLGRQTLDMRSGDFPKLPAPESRRQTRGSREPARPTAQRAGRERGAPGRRRRTRTQLPRHRDCDTPFWPFHRGAGDRGGARCGPRHQDGLSARTAGGTEPILRLRSRVSLRLCV